MGARKLALHQVLRQAHRRRGQQIAQTTLTRHLATKKSVVIGVSIQSVVMVFVSRFHVEAVEQQFLMVVILHIGLYATHGAKIGEWRVTSRCRAIGIINAVWHPMRFLCPWMLPPLTSFFKVSKATRTSLKERV